MKTSILIASIWTLCLFAGACGSTHTEAPKNFSKTGGTPDTQTDAKINALTDAQKSTLDDVDASAPPDTRVFMYDAFQPFLLKSAELKNLLNPALDKIHINVKKDGPFSSLTAYCKWIEKKQIGRCKNEKDLWARQVTLGKRGNIYAATTLSIERTTGKRAPKSAPCPVLIQTKKGWWAIGSSKGCQSNPSSVTPTGFELIQLRFADEVGFGVVLFERENQVTHKKKEIVQGKECSITSNLQYTMRMYCAAGSNGSLQCSQWIPSDCTYNSSGSELDWYCSNCYYSQELDNECNYKGFKVSLKKGRISIVKVASDQDDTPAQDENDDVDKELFCIDCRVCENCDECIDCEDCDNCDGCEDCEQCIDCDQCRDCDDDEIYPFYPFIATKLYGPFESVEQYCSSPPNYLDVYLNDKYQYDSDWSPKKCVLKNTGWSRTHSDSRDPLRDARLLRFSEYSYHEGVPDSETCKVAMKTQKGWYVTEHLDYHGFCTGPFEMNGETSAVTREVRWVGKGKTGVLAIVFQIYKRWDPYPCLAESYEECNPANTETHNNVTASTKDEQGVVPDGYNPDICDTWIMLCGKGKSGIPSCTNRIFLGDCNFKEINNYWSYEKGKLKLEVPSKYVYSTDYNTGMQQFIPGEYKVVFP